MCFTIFVPNNVLENSSTRNLLSTPHRCHVYTDKVTVIWHGINIMSCTDVYFFIYFHFGIVWVSDEQDVIVSYYWEGFKYASIVRFLSQYHNIEMSVRTLHRRLADYGLSRCKQPAPFTAVWNAIREELRGPGKLAVGHVLAKFITALLWQIHIYFH